jgi:hypothetical protein
MPLADDGLRAGSFAKAIQLDEIGMLAKFLGPVLLIDRSSTTEANRAWRADQGWQ